MDYCQDKFGSMVTEESMAAMMANRDMTMTSSIAEMHDADISVESIEFINSEETDKGIYYQFKCETKLVSRSDGKEYTYPVHGQVGLIEVEEGYKVDIIRFFSVGLYKHME